jgi:transcriptional regulator with XRE-family HTH domain
MSVKAIYNSRYRALVEFIRAARKKKGMTQSELGRRLRLSRQAIQKIESCAVRLDLIRYVTLCRVLGLRAGRLLGRLEEPSDEDDPPFSCQTLLRGREGVSYGRPISKSVLVATFCF